MAFDYFKPKQTSTNFSFAKVSGAFKQTGYYKINADGVINTKLLFEKLIEAGQFSGMAKGSVENPLLQSPFNEGGIPPITEPRILEDFHYLQYTEESSEWEVPDLSLVNNGNSGNTAIDPFLVAHPPAKSNEIFKVWLSRRTPGDVLAWPMYGMQSKIAGKTVNYYMIFSYTEEGKTESVQEGGTDLSDGVVISQQFDYVAGKFEKGTEEERVPAIFVFTTEFEAFLALAQSIVVKSSQDPASFFEKRYAYYSFAFREVYDKEKIAQTDDFQLIKNFYQLIPEPCLRKITDQELINDLLRLLYFDAFSIFDDSSFVMLKILKNFSDLSVPYKLLHESPLLTTEIFDHINGSSKTIEYCSFLTGLSLIYQPVEDSAQLPVILMGGAYSSDKSNFFTSDGMIRITVYRTEVESGGFSGDKEDRVKIESKTFIVSDQIFNPLDLVILQNAETGEQQIVCALYVQYLVELEFWDAVVSAVVVVLNMVSIFFAAGLIIKGAVGLIRIFALADIAISALDIALQNKDFVAYLSKTESGKWLVENWTAISMTILSGVMSIQMAEQFFKHGDEAVRILTKAKTDFPELGKSIDEQVEAIKKLQSKAGEILSQGDGLVKKIVREATELDLKRINKIRKTYKCGTSKNVAFCEGEIAGIRINLDSVSGGKKSNWKQKGNFQPPEPENYYFKGGPEPYKISHTEQKIFEYLYRRFKNKKDVFGKIEIVTDLKFCDNCDWLISQFEKEFKNLEIVRVFVKNKL